VINLKRDILIFPKFKNIELIQKIREDYDELAYLVSPHITLVFPFTDDIDTPTLSKKIKETIKDFKPFNIKFKGVSLNSDNYIFLNCIEGNSQIIALHDKIYEKVLPTHLNKNIEYIPHITIGTSDSIEFLNNFNFEFEDEIDEIVIEGIGIHQESIILDKIKLNSKR
jgi:2'-5' RNA ligase